MRLLKTNILDFFSKTDEFSVTEGLVIDVGEFAERINQDYKKLIIDPPAGFYLTVGGTEPIVKEGVTYEAVCGTQSERYIGTDSFPEGMTELLSIDGDTVLNRYLCDNVDKYLVKTPLLPVSALKLVSDLVYHTLIHANPYKALLVSDPLRKENDFSVVPRRLHDITHTSDLIAQYLRDDVTFDEETVESFANGVTEIVDDLLIEVLAWTKNHKTNIYLVELDTRSLIVGRSVDIRAYRYQLLLEDAEETEKE